MSSAVSSGWGRGGRGAVSASQILGMGCSERPESKEKPLGPRLCFHAQSLPSFSDSQGHGVGVASSKMELGLPFLSRTI